MYSNVNGYQSKSDSLKATFKEIDPGIIVMCETKLPKVNTIKSDFKNYDLVTKQVKKGKAGILCAVKKNMGASLVLEVTTVNNENILTVKISFAGYDLRVVVAYGPQENEPVEIKDEFFKDIEIEVEASKVNGDYLLLVGDLNSKIEMKNEKVQAMSNNGKYLAELVKKNNLEVLNFSSKCTGKWTHEVRTSGKSSVLDYILVDNEFDNFVTEMIIDEECLFTPFRTVSTKLGSRTQYSDHNTILCKFKVERKRRNVGNENEDISEESWIFNQQGWQSFKDTTSTVPCNINSANEPNIEYDKLEKYIKDSMDKCFKKRKARRKMLKDNLPKSENACMRGNRTSSLSLSLGL